MLFVDRSEDRGWRVGDALPGACEERIGGDWHARWGEEIRLRSGDAFCARSGDAFRLRSGDAFRLRSGDAFRARSGDAFRARSNEAFRANSGARLALERIALARFSAEDRVGEVGEAGEDRNARAANDCTACWNPRGEDVLFVDCLAASVEGWERWEGGAVEDENADRNARVEDDTPRAGGFEVGALAPPSPGGSG